MSSIVQRDDEIIKKGRKKLHDEKADPRDQLKKKLFDKLNDMAVASMVDKLILTGDSNRTEWLENQQEFLASWDEMIQSTAEGPFEGSSDLHVPVALITARAMHARFVQALLGIDPPFQIKGRTEAEVESASTVQDLMSYGIKDWCNNYQGAERELDGWVWDWVTTGCGLLKQRWDCQYESYMDIEDSEVDDLPALVQDENGMEKLVPRKRKESKEKRVVKKVFEGPVWKRVLVEDLLIVGGAGDIHQADSIHETDYATASVLWNAVDREVFDEEAVEKVINSGRDLKAVRMSGNIKQQRMLSTGEAMIDNISELDKYEITESYLRLDVDGTGINSEIVVWTHRKSKTLLGCNYLRRMHKSGLRPFSKIDFHLRQNQTYGMGIVEMMHPISKEIDAIHNMRVDNGLLSNMPIGFYRPSSSINPEKLQIEPGMLIPVDNPATDIVFPQMGNKVSFGFQEEQGLQTLLERLTGTNDMMLGVMSGNQGAARTATGARSLVNEGNANLNIFLRRLNRGWKTALKIYLGMLQQRLPKGFSFRITGETGNDFWRQVRTPEEIAGTFDIEVSPNSENSNKMVQQDVANQVYQMTLNPLLIQMGIVGPGQIWEAHKNVLRNLGVKDFGRYVLKPQDYQYLPSPMEEANRLLRGVPVEVTPQMDHEGFLKVFQEIFGTDELLGQFSEESALRLAAQAKRHESMMQALQQQAAQQANMQQQQINASQSAIQTAPGAPTPQAQPPQGAGQPQGQ